VLTRAIFLGVPTPHLLRAQATKLKIKLINNYDNDNKDASLCLLAMLLLPHRHPSLSPPHVDCHFMCSIAPLSCALRRSDNTASTNVIPCPPIKKGIVAALTMMPTKSILIV
jgi:hypothetical protein